MSRAVDVPFDFDPVPSASAAIAVSVGSSVPDGVQALGVGVAEAGDVPAEVGLTRAALIAAGFTGALGQTLSVPSESGPVVVAVGVGGGEPSAARSRDAAAAFALAAGAFGDLAVQLEGFGDDAETAQAVVEGVLLALKGEGAAEEVAASQQALERVGGGRAEVLTCGVGVVDPPTTVVRVVRLTAGRRRGSR